MIGREITIRHVAACAVCGWLSRFAIRRRDPALLEAAIRLRATHAENDTEREAFARRDERRSEAGRVTLSCSDTRGWAIR
jgi:hypothetical protein